MAIPTSYPGVYIEETAAGPRPIEGVATSTTAFLGRALRGPTGAPGRQNRGPNSNGSMAGCGVQYARLCRAAFFQQWRRPGADRPRPQSREHCQGHRAGRRCWLARRQRRRLGQRSSRARGIPDPEPANAFKLPVKDSAPARARFSQKCRSTPGDPRFIASYPRNSNRSLCASMAWRPRTFRRPAPRRRPAAMLSPTPRPRFAGGGDGDDITDGRSPRTACGRSTTPSCSTCSAFRR